MALTNEELYAWMDQNRRKRIPLHLVHRLYLSRKKGSKKILLTHLELDTLLTIVNERKADNG